MKYSASPRAGRCTTCTGWREWLAEEAEAGKTGVNLEVEGRRGYLEAVEVGTLSRCLREEVGSTQVVEADIYQTVRVQDTDRAQMEDVFRIFRAEEVEVHQVVDV